MLKLQVLWGHLTSLPESGPVLQTVPCFGSFLQASAADVVLLRGGCTPSSPQVRVPLQDTTPDELLSAVLTAVLRDVKLRPEQLGDISEGNVLHPGGGAIMARIAQFLGSLTFCFTGIPDTVPLSIVNGQCSSGLQAVANIVGGIRNGSYDIGMACGVESMSMGWKLNPGNITSRMGLEVHFQKARDCLIPMGITSENVVKRFGVSKEKQDSFALASQQKAAREQRKGCFRAEIVPVTTTIHDDKGTKRSITVSQDEGICPNTAMEGLAKLKPAFKDGGSPTAANTSNGAGPVLLARRSKAEELGLPILGVLRSYAVVGVPPDVMGIGPAYAIPEALEKAGLTVNDMDIFEINEAIVSQAVYCVEKLGIPPEKVNLLGEVVALGHPLGCTGARQVITLLNELKRRGKRAYGVVSMCIGTGMGATAVFEYPGN
nr:3-ketoacyl-CoA thiolase A, peroxisomal-like [Marmota flaviventris]